MKFNYLLAALVALTSAELASATIIVNVSEATAITDPLSGAELDQYSVSLSNLDSNERVTGVNLVISGPLHNIQLANFLGNVSPSPDISFFEGFPASFIDADTHSEIAASEYVIPPGSGDLSEDILPSAGANNPTSGFLSELRLVNLALGAQLQTDSVLLANVVLPRGGAGIISGIASASNDGGNPVQVSQVIGVPEPTSFILAGLGLVATLGVRRNKIRS